MWEIVLAIALCGTNPVELVARDRVDLIEVNHFHDDEAQFIFTQVIFWNWVAGRYEVVAWRMLRTKCNPQPRPGLAPERMWPSRDWVSTWDDGGTLRRVRARLFEETWTQHDPEFADRSVLHEKLRRGFSRPGPIPPEPVIQEPGP